MFDSIDNAQDLGGCLMFYSLMHLAQAKSLQRSFLTCGSVNRASDLCDFNLFHFPSKFIFITNIQKKIVHFWKKNATILIKRNHKNQSPLPFPIFITVREIKQLRGSNPAFPPAYAFHFKKPAKIHFFLYPQSVGDIFFRNVHCLS